MIDYNASGKFLEEALEVKSSAVGAVVDLL